MSDVVRADCATKDHGCIGALIELSFRWSHTWVVPGGRAHVTATFRTSLEIAVSVRGEDTVTGEEWPTVECRTTFVAMSDNRTPTPLPPLLLESDEDRAAQVAAEERRRARLAKR